MRSDNAHSRSPDDEFDNEPAFTPLTAEQAQSLRDRRPSVSPWWIVGAQLLVGLGAAWVAWALSADRGVGWSVLCGSWAVALPAALFAWAVARAPGVELLAWELVKIGLTVALLGAALKLVPGLNWLALLAGVILATKMYWVALAWMRRPRKTGN